MQMKRVALSGGPGTGKTSLIQFLENAGYPVSHEYSRQIIQKSLKEGSNVLPWEDLDRFSHLVMEGRLEQYRSAKGEIHFFDRTIIDTIAYQKADDLPVRDEWHQQAMNLRYFQEVYLTPPWLEIFENDDERKESFEKLEHLHQVLVDTYYEYGYEVIEVPKFNIEERVKWILKRVG